MGLVYYYGMKYRGFAPACQPIEGLIERQDDWTGRYYDVLVYGRELNVTELECYDLELIGYERSME